MHPPSESHSPRDYVSYYNEFNDLPFERLQEKFRRRKLIEIIENQISGALDNVLEIGPGYNSVLSELQLQGNSVILEPSSQLFEYNQSQYSGKNNVLLLNEDIKECYSRYTAPIFDLVIMSSVLHELSDPKTELSMILKMMKKGGSIIVVVPNNESIHRQFGVTLGILPCTSALTGTEKLMQQKQNFSIGSLSRFLNEFELITQFVTTSFVKPHTHHQMQEWINEGVLNEDNLENLYELSKFFHPFNSEIFLIASKS